MQLKEVGRHSLKQMTDLETKGSGDALGDHYVKTVLTKFFAAVKSCPASAMGLKGHYLSQILS